MANVKEVAVIHTIRRLYELGRSQRAIARELGIDRETVRRYLRGNVPGNSNPAIPTAGNTGDSGEQPTGAEPAASTEVGAPETSNPAIPTAGRRSLCEPFRARIEKDASEGLSAQRIYQDLVREDAFDGSYESVKRFVGRLRREQPRRFERIESQPGEEAQVDFGSGPRVPKAGSGWKKTWVFRIVLSYSRKAYSEAVYHQDTESFIRCLENAFRAFGGVPATLVIDNLSAAVKRADWYDPELNPKIEAFARHYEVLILPTRPRHPHHKGKVENAVGYVKKNALKGRSFESLTGVNEFLEWWETHVADQRIHGTTRRQIAAHFEQERPSLGTLPPMLFPFFHEGRRTVHRDSHVEVAKAYYEVPDEYIGRQVWVRWDKAMVRVFNLRMEPVIAHARVPEGQFCASSAPASRQRVKRASGYPRQQAALLGVGCAQWADAIIEERGFAAVRILQGLVALSKTYTAEAIDTACAQALCSRALRLRDIRRLLDQPDRQTQFEFLDTHPLIRPMNVYAEFLNTQPQEVPHE